MSIAASDKITPRPVWRRHLRRTMQNINPMPPPTDEEKYDAIRVLEDPWNAGEPGLWREAHLIFMEASVVSRREALNELTRLAEEYPGGYR